MKKFHIAIAVSDIERSIVDYSKRLGHAPHIIIPHEYALWRTELLNLSIRKTKDTPGTVRHIGWEDPAAEKFTAEKDVNGLVWELFNAEHQLEEIHEAWPEAKL